VPFGQDGNYSREAIVQRINADLANDLGNLAQRCLTMIARNAGGRLPQPAPYSAKERALLAAADGMIKDARAAMKEQQLHQMLNAVFAVVAEANRDFATAAPWELAKSDPARMATVLYLTAEVLRQVAILAQPVMPAAMAKLLDLLAVDQAARTFAFLGDRGRLNPGTALPPPNPVFPRYIEPEAGAGQGKTAKGNR